MKHLEIVFGFTDELGLKSVQFNYNDTGLPEDSELLRRVACALIESLSVNKESLKVQDILNQLDITIKE
jgi:hypothetical protein